MAQDLIFGKTKRNWSCGSLLLPAKQQKALFAKIDDVRYDIRRAGVKISAATLVLGGALALLAVSSIYRTSATAPKLR